MGLFIDSQRDTTKPYRAQFGSLEMIKCHHSRKILRNLTHFRSLPYVSGRMDVHRMSQSLAKCYYDRFNVEMGMTITHPSL